MKSNKIRDIFSDEPLEKYLTITYDSSEGHNKFAKALEKVWSSGNRQAVESECSIQTESVKGDIKYPGPTFYTRNFIISPSYDEVPFTFETKEDSHTIVFKRCYAKNKVILETSIKDIVEIKLVFNQESDKLNLSFHTFPTRANEIQDILSAYNLALSFFGNFKQDNCSEENDENNQFEKNIIKLQESLLFFDRMHSLEEKLGVTFELSDSIDDADNREKIDELYVLLIKKQPIRLEGKINENEIKFGKILDDEIETFIGKPIQLTFFRDIEYSLLGANFHIYTANLLSNAIIDKIKKNEDGNDSAQLTDLDSNPMYVSFTAFTNEEDAHRELENIMQNIGAYENASTPYEIIYK